MTRYKTRPGSRFPPGASPGKGGVNFSIFSRHATRVELLLYEAADSTKAFQVVEIDPDTQRTFFFWHVFVEDLPTGTYYTWRVDGPGDTARNGFRFSPQVELLDPWAPAISNHGWDREKATDATVTMPPSIRAIVADDVDYDWQGDQPINYPLEHTVIYELHVGGFTRHPSSGVQYPGTFAGLVEKIPYLKELGVTDVQLLPVMAFDEQDVALGARERGLKNFWGYSPHSYFAPHPGYCVRPNEPGQRREFREMVRALHEAGIGVILDVVFNHTAEGGRTGPTINFKGFANEIMYHLDPRDRREYRDFTGCGNTVNCNHPIVTNFLDACLEYWVQHMHVDGFRFDLASVLARGEDGKPMYHAPVLWGIEFSRALAQTKLIAEAWDAGGLYQVGDFPGLRWAEWNGRYRDVVRRFVQGVPGLISEIATRVAGSSDLYEAGGRLPSNSINFVTCHDGFTLWDLVSYERKNNEANGEDNRDGSDANYSWNCGAEGLTDDPAVNRLRVRQAKNLMAILFLSQGVPMILAGDESLRTQRGNNNAYCQDNELSWINWEHDAMSLDMQRFVRGLIALRKSHASLRRTRFFRPGRREGQRMPDITWHGVELEAPPWGDPSARSLAYTLAAATPDRGDLHIMFNMSGEKLSFGLPAIDDRRWHVAIDTSLAAPADLPERDAQPAHGYPRYEVGPHSVVVLENRPS